MQNCRLQQVSVWNIHSTTMSSDYRKAINTASTTPRWCLRKRHENIAGCQWKNTNKCITKECCHDEAGKPILKKLPETNRQEKCRWSVGNVNSLSLDKNKHKLCRQAVATAEQLLHESQKRVGTKGVDEEDCVTLVDCPGESWLSP